MFACLEDGTLEEILTGEVPAGEMEGEHFPEKLYRDIPEDKRARTEEILTYVKNQSVLRRQRQAFQLQLAQSQAHRDALEEQLDGSGLFDGAQQELDAEECNSTESEGDDGPSTLLERVWAHCSSSSLLLFPQDSLVRNLCQACMSTDGEDEGAKKGAKEEGVKKAAAAPAPTPSGNQVGALDKGGNSESSPSKRRLARSFVDKARNTIQLESLSPSPVVSPVKGLGDLSGKSIKVGADSLGATLLKKKEEPKVNVAAKVFDGVIMNLILVSSITLVIDHPLANPDSPDIILVGYMDNCFTILFTIEAVIKVVALGFFVNNASLRAKGLTPYIRNPWNQLDFVVVLSALIDFAVTLQN